MYAHLVDPSTPESRARTLQQVAERYRSDGRQLMAKAEELRAEAAAAAEKCLDDVAARLRSEADAAEETAKLRYGAAAVYEERAQQEAAAARVSA